MKKKQKKTVVKKVTKKVHKKSVVKVVAPTAPKNTSGITPLSDRVLVKPMIGEELHKTTAFGIIIPDTAKEKPEQGVVVAVGKGKRTEDGTLMPVSVSVGDTVLFNKYGFDEVKVNGVEYYIIQEQNILAILD